MVPWVFFSVISGIIEICVGKINQDTNAPFNGPLWFLQTLFVAIVIYTVLHSLKRRYMHILCFSLPIVVYFVKSYTNWYTIIPFNLDRALMATFFIHMGWCYKQKFGEKKFPLYGLIFCAIVYMIGVFVSIHYYDCSCSNFVSGKAYLYNLPLSLVTSISGIIALLSLSRIIRNVPFINWLGKNSLVIMLVHFPFLERLNHLCFSYFREYSPSTVLKLLAVLVAYAATVIFSCVCVYLCKRYIPKLTGYKSIM